MSITDLLTPLEPAGQSGRGGFVLGTVAENNSQDFPGMVKVAFTGWTEGENLSKWLPVLSSYAGMEHGRYLIPEVDDIVLVGFIGPMMEQPFVLGGFFPVGAALPGELSDDKNTNRHLKTKGGVELAVSDEDGKQSVAAQTPKGLKICIEDESESITVSDKDGKNILKLDCAGGGVELSADKTITLKAGSCELIMDGAGGAITIKGGQLALEGSQKAELKSGNMLTLEGGMATVEGKQTLTLKGSAMCEISGGMVKIN
jgi:uncharacterized protein involved in type VI secretion and phage assembly